MTGSPPPETTAPLESITWPSVAVVAPISWPAMILCAAVVSELSAALQQRVAGHQEGGARGREHGDHDGDRGRQHEPGAEGHASRST